MDMKPDMIEYIKKHPMWYGVGWIALLGVLAWLFQSWPSGFWGWLRETPDGYESHMTTARSVFLALAAVVGLVLAIWRARVADRQSKTAQRSLLNEQYQKGAEMLGSEVLSVRLGGIYALARLAREHPEEYHVQIMRLFCAFVRNLTKEDKKGEENTKEMEAMFERGAKEEGEEKPELRPDVQEIMSAIGYRGDAQIDIENQEKPTYRLDLCKANLINAQLGRANLSNADLRGVGLCDAWLLRVNLSGALLTRADLSNAKLMGADLSNVQLMWAKLPGTWLDGVNLSGAKLWRADLSGANLSTTEVELYEEIQEGGIKSTGESSSAVTVLTQSQLDEARAESDNLPKIDGVLDAETGEQLVWNG